MRSLLLILTLLSLVHLGALAGPEDEALRVVAKWAKTFAESDVDGIVGLYAPDALFLGTGSKAVVREQTEIRRYFERALLNDRPRGATLTERSILVLSDTAVIVTGLDLVTGIRDGAPTRSVGRVTFIVARRGADWKIVHFHRSALPN